MIPPSTYELTTTTLPAPRTAYGLRIEGLASRYLQEGGDGLPSVRIERGEIEGERAPTRVENGRAEIRLIDGGQLLVDREARLARFLTVQPLDDDDLAHPYLAAAASVLAGWDGREAFHAGAYAVGGRAVAVLGAKEGGKSTTLAALALAGVEVLTDDVLVLEGAVALPGPRCVDLRPAAAEQFGADAPLEHSRAGERFRLLLPPAPSERRLAAAVSLAWGDRIELVRLPAAERLVRFAQARSGETSPRDESVLELAALPCFELRRPRLLEQLPDVCARLVELAAG